MAVLFLFEATYWRDHGQWGVEGHRELDTSNILCICPGFQPNPTLLLKLKTPTICLIPANPPVVARRQSAPIDRINRCDGGFSSPSSGCPGELSCPSGLALRPIMGMV